MTTQRIILATLLFFSLHAFPGSASAYAPWNDEEPGSYLPLVAVPGDGLGHDDGYRQGVTSLLDAQGSEDFETRRQDLLNAVITLQQNHTYGGKFAYWYAQALLAKGQVYEGLSEVEACLLEPPDSRPDPMFHVWAMADTYLRWQHVLAQTTQDAFKQQLTSFEGYDGGTTENHRLMLATARYLAAEAWPNAAFASDYPDSDPTGRRFLLKKMEKYVHRGTVEFDSPTYHAFYLGVMRSLADLAQDPEVRQRAALAVEWLILEDAPEWLDGHWLSASLRHKSYYDGQTDFRPADYVLWLYFGASFQPDFADKHALFAVQAAASAYRLPASVGIVATDRSGAFVHRETDTWSGDRHYKTTYLDRDYGLYSVMEDYPVHQRYSKQYHRWAVQWRSDQAKSTLYVKHPHKKTGEEGTTGYEQVLQHAGTLLAVYKIPATYPTRYVRIRTPQGFEAVLDESAAGGVYLHYGTVLVALRLSASFAWDAGSDVHDHAATVLGVVVETAPPGDYAGNALQQLLMFKQEVQAHALDFSVTGANPKLVYTNLHGLPLEITYGGARKVNGVVVDLESWPLLENPWMQQAYEGDVLVVTTCEQQVAYDFGAWTREITAKDSGDCEKNPEARISRTQPDPRASLTDANPAGVPASFTLEQNYPNPFNPTTTIPYTLSADAYVSLKVYNLLGQEIATLVEGRQARGAYSARWDGRDLAGRAVSSGTYLYRIEAGDFVQTRAMVFIQ